MKLSRASLAISLSMILSVAVPAKDKYAPLPEKITKAQRVFILNRSGEPEIGDIAYRELRKWGRYSITQKMEDADLVFALSAAQTGERTTMVQFGDDTITTNASATQYGNTVDGSATTTVNRAPVIPITHATGVTTLSIFDPKIPEASALWSITRSWASGGATKLCIKELRKRVEDK
jgi:hypothetical protein